MSGITALPIPSQERIHVFYNTNRSILALDTRNGIYDEEKPEPKFVPANTTPKGHTFDASDLAVARFMDIPFVVGVTKVGEGDSTEHQISILSPVFRALEPVEEGTTAVTFCSAGDKASVFYIDGTSPTIGELREYILDSTKEQVDSKAGFLSTHGGVANISRGSSLASYFKGDDRMVIYQDTEGVLREYSASEKNNAQIKGTENSAQRTPIAAVYGQDDKVYLYYCDKKRVLHRVVKAGNTWEVPRRLPNAMKVPQLRQLSVVQLANANHLFWICEGSDGEVTHFRD